MELDKKWILARQHLLTTIDALQRAADTFQEEPPDEDYEWPELVSDAAAALGGALHALAGEEAAGEPQSSTLLRIAGNLTMAVSDLIEAPAITDAE